MKTLHGLGMGWQHDLPDMRDCTPESERIDRVLSKSAPLRKARNWSMTKREYTDTNLFK
jgi:hypothetical protein